MLTVPDKGMTSTRWIYQGHDLCFHVYHQDHWHTEMMTAAEVHTDPLQTVLAEGGPYHTKGKLEKYCRRLETTDRHWAADKLRTQYNRGA